MVSEDESIVDWNDKFGLVRFSDATLLLQHLKKCNYEYTFDQLTYFLLRVQEIYDSQDRGRQEVDRQALQGLLEHLKRLLRENRQGKYPLIGQLAFSLNRMRVEDP